MINLQRLEGFYWVAKTSGYARAARAFPYPITQPGVHQQVRRLESQLAVKLFERAGKDRVALTPSGQALFDAVAPFYEALPALEARVRGRPIGGTLKVHAAGYLLRALLPPWLRRLQSRRPELAVTLTELRAADVSLLRTGESDLLVDWLPSVPPDVEVRELARAEAWLVAPAHGPHARRGRLSLKALAAVPFITYQSDRTSRQLQLAAARAHGISPVEAFSADSADTILGFVAAGLGFSLVPSLDPTGPKVAGVVAQKLERPARSFPIYAAWRKGGARHALVAAALDAM